MPAGLLDQRGYARRASFEGQADPEAAGGTADAGARVGLANVPRAGLAEMVGAFLVIYAGTATAVAATLGKETGGSPPDSLAIALACGFVLAAMVGALGNISGAHLNPAVTLGLAVIGKFSWRAVPVYLLFQLLGAILGALATWATFGGRRPQHRQARRSRPDRGHQATAGRSSSRRSSRSCWSSSSSRSPATGGPRAPPPG